MKSKKKRRFYVIVDKIKNKYVFDWGNHLVTNIEDAEVFDSFDWHPKKLLKAVIELNKDINQDRYVLKSFNYKAINLKNVT